jgi:hypothetical protein
LAAFKTLLIKANSTQGCRVARVSRQVKLGGLARGA